MSEPEAEDPAMLRRAAFGMRVQRLRRAQGLTLQQVSDSCGLAVSTISKIENSHLSPTYDVMLKLAQGLGTDIVSLFEHESAPVPKPALKGRMAVMRGSEAVPLDAGPYVYEPITTRLKDALIDATLVTVVARDPGAFEAPIRHAGEELVHVLSGAVELHTDLYAPIRLEAGDSVHYDAVMAHAFVSVSDEDARILNIVAGGSPRKDS
ncbi:helix-turn-helix domain-containing protein [Aquicoccus porphyridii]|uniref:helix-turn-helix domain-containing protein n=1 Tax=Aquicoccus porphyridii TaxID=1852029 RepID=UPI00273D828A|nr:XRE family transcriptional regulator [Aquicoccus porphyridii]